MNKNVGITTEKSIRIRAVEGNLSIECGAYPSDKSELYIKFPNGMYVSMDIEGHIRIDNIPSKGGLIEP